CGVVRPAPSTAAVSEEVAAARVEINAQCDCTSALNHDGYMTCVKRAARKMVRSRAINRKTRHQLVKCAAKSTCGRDEGGIACCRHLPNGRTQCTIAPSAEGCERQPGAVATTCSSCCDACDGGMCEATTTTTPSGSSTTTTMPPTSSCGDAIIEPGEECDPPGSPCTGSAGGAMLECSATCQCVPVGGSTTTTQP